MAAIRERGGQAVAIQADVAVDAEVVAMFTQVDRELPPLQGLVNNAGVVDQAQRVDETGEARLQRMFSINVFGSFYCAREAVRRLATPVGGGGSIVNLSSAAGPPGWGRQLRRLRRQQGRHRYLHGRPRQGGRGARHPRHAVRPGLIETEIHASGGQPDRARQLASQVPMLRTGTAEEVAEAIVWLLGDAASYCTGSFIDVGGGR